MKLKWSCLNLSYAVPEIDSAQVVNMSHIKSFPVSWHALATLKVIYNRPPMVLCVKSIRKNLLYDGLRCKNSAMTGGVNGHSILAVCLNRPHKNAEFH